MPPFRAFLVSFVAGSIALFGGYGAIAAMTPAPIGNTITV
jgi:Na+/glutamate symporter